MRMDLNKEFAIKLSAMLEARLIWYKHYFIFCDEIIDKYDVNQYNTFFNQYFNKYIEREVKHK